MVTQENKDDIERITWRIEHLKMDFEMLKDGRWDINYSDGSECDASIDSCDMILELLGKLSPSNVNECINEVSSSKQRHAKYII